MDLYKNVNNCLTSETNKKYVNFYIEYKITDIQKKNWDHSS